MQLIGLIELARIEGRGPAIPEDLTEAYNQATRDAASMIESLLPQLDDVGWCTELSACLAAFKGDVATARALLDAD